MDGEFQTYVTKDGAYIRKHFFGKYPELLELVAHLSDEEVFKLRRGGHDPKKVYNAYKQALETKGEPTVILAKTVKGYGLGEAGEGRNISHQQKKLNEAGDRALPLALRDSDSRRSGAQRVVLPAAGGQPGDALPARAAAPAGRLHAQPRTCRPATSRRRRSST